VSATPRRPGTTAGDRVPLSPMGAPSAPSGWCDRLALAFAGAGRALSGQRLRPWSRIRWTQSGQTVCVARAKSCATRSSSSSRHAPSTNARPHHAQRRVSGVRYGSVVPTVLCSRARSGTGIGRMAYPVRTSDAPRRAGRARGRRLTDTMKPRAAAITPTCDGGAVRLAAELSNPPVDWFRCVRCSAREFATRGFPC
jgi:hypothetical protein